MSDYIWIGWVGSGVVIVILVWVNFVKPWCRKRALKYPAKITFRGGASELEIISAGDRVVEFQLVPNLTFNQERLVVGFEAGKAGRIPTFRHYENTANDIQAAQIVSPDPGNRRHDPRHKLIKGRYHIEEDVRRIKGRTYVFGFRIGDLPTVDTLNVNVWIDAEGVEGRAKAPLTLILKRQP